MKELRHLYLNYICNMQYVCVYPYLHTVFDVVQYTCTCSIQMPFACITYLAGCTNGFILAPDGCSVVHRSQQHGLQWVHCLFCYVICLFSTTVNSVSIQCHVGVQRCPGFRAVVRGWVTAATPGCVHTEILDNCRTVWGESLSECIIPVQWLYLMNRCWW